MSSQLREGVLAFTFLFLGLAIFLFGMYRAVNKSHYRYTDDKGCKHFDEGYIERIECRN